jgi:hypothetical protein
MLFIKEGIREERDLRLEGAAQFEKTMRNLCGLFVRVVDSRIFLIHQTAKNYLIRTVENQASVPVPWTHSLQPDESHFILARICLMYLLFSDFEILPSDIQMGGDKAIKQYVIRHHFVDYVAKHWVSHFQKCEPEGAKSLLELALQVCDARLQRWRIWLMIYWWSGLDVNLDVDYFPSHSSTYQ